VILDTNALSAFADEHPAILTILAQVEQLAIPVIVLGEYRYGIAQSRHKTRYLSWLDGLLADGTMSTGDVHEGLNLAALWDLGVVFVCEDNAWAISVAKATATAIANNSDRAAAYGIPGVLIPDNDPEAIFEAAGEAVARARAKKGPTLIEIKTDRLLGHFEGDPQLYRTKEEMETLQKRDALKHYEQQLIKAGTLTTESAEQVWKAGRAEVDAAIEFARKSPYPEPESALLNVFA